MTNSKKYWKNIFKMLEKFLNKGKNEKKYWNFLKMMMKKNIVKKVINQTKKNIVEAAKSKNNQTNQSVMWTSKFHDTIKKPLKQCICPCKKDKKKSK